MPDVPNLPGVPNLNGYAVEGIPTLITQDTATPLSDAPQQWGIYLDGTPVIVADTVFSFEYRQDWDICDAPVEQGAFMSYNKVNIPYTVRLRFITGGSLADREAMLSSVQAVAGTLTVYDAVSPEAVYPSVNIVHFDYQRSSVKGLGLLVIDVFLQQVRIINTSSSTIENNSSTSGSNSSTTPGVGGSSATPGSIVSSTTPSTQNAPGNTLSASGAYAIGNGTLQPLTSSVLAQNGISSSVFLADIGA